MAYDKEGVHALVCALEDVKNSNLIFVDKNLRNVLKCLAFYEEFRTVLAYCNKNFDYETEKRKALTRVGDSNILRLPKNPKTLVALVSNMLVEFDAGAMDILGFSASFCPADTKQESFDVLYNKLLEPFKLALVNFVVEGIREDAPEISHQVEFAHSGLTEQVEYLLVGMAKAVQEAQLSDELRAEFGVMLEGFSVALDSRDSLMIKAIWTGLRRALADEKLALQEIEKVDEALRLYLISK
ncbi:MAG: hypothetical protein IK048_05205 [Clostridia bacterium]|nr:hypothetical protein [Clostridia bacterium]